MTAPHGGNSSHPTTVQAAKVMAGFTQQPNTEQSMANSVYLTVCDTLSQIVSRRAAENIVQEALLSAGTDAEQVSLHQMQDVLRGKIFSRLQQIIPIAQARLEIKSALGKLEAMIEPINKPLAPEVLEGLEALQKEFAPFQNMDHSRVHDLAQGMRSLNQAADPVKKLNALWAELDVLQQELGFIGIEERRLTATELAPDMIGSDIEFDGFDGVDLDFADQEAAATQQAEARETRISGAAIPHQPPNQAQAAVATLAQPTLKLHTPHEADALLSRFALEEGVIGVVLSDTHGQVIQAKLPNGQADHLAGVAAATSALLNKRKPFGVFYTSLGEASVFIAPLDECLLVVLSDAHVNVGRVLSEVKAIKEEV
jgi:predicted regulator of Ras-like GTPase activity (Roadblock/LC7/MglB family)